MVFILWKHQFITMSLLKRAILNINNDCYHTEPLFKNTAIFRLSDVYAYQLCLFMHDSVNKELPHSFGSVFHLNSDIQDEHVNKAIRSYECTSMFSIFLPYGTIVPVHVQIKITN